MSMLRLQVSLLMVGLVVYSAGIPMRLYAQEVQAQETDQEESELDENTSAQDEDEAPEATESPVGQPAQAGVPAPQAVSVQATPLANSVPQSVSMAPSAPTAAQPVAVTSSTPLPTAQSVTPVAQPVAVTASVPAAAHASAIPEVKPMAAVAAMPMTVPVQPPVPVATASAVMPTDQDFEIKGIDTVEIEEPKGNWLYKRIWWERAERMYEKIRQLVNQIFETRISYFGKRVSVDRTVIDPFYTSVGRDQASILAAIAYYTDQLTAERQQEGMLSLEERELLQAIEDEKKNLEQLAKSIENVGSLDNALDDALMKLIEQMNLCRTYENQAWDKFKAINRELSDKKAREYFYAMDTYWTNINNINTYISGAFSSHFDLLIQKITQETQSIESSLAALKEKGIDLKAQAERLKKGVQKPVEQEPEEEVQPKPEGWLSWVWNGILNTVKAPFILIGNAISSASEWVSGLFGKKPVENTSIDVIGAHVVELDDYPMDDEDDLEDN